MDGTGIPRYGHCVNPDTSTPSARPVNWQTVVVEQSQRHQLAVALSHLVQTWPGWRSIIRTPVVSYTRTRTATSPTSPAPPLPFQSHPLRPSSIFQPEIDIFRIIHVVPPPLGHVQAFFPFQFSSRGKHIRIRPKRPTERNNPKFNRCNLPFTSVRPTAYTSNTAQVLNSIQLASASVFFRPSFNKPKTKPYEK